MTFVVDRALKSNIHQPQSGYARNRSSVTVVYHRVDTMMNTNQFLIKIDTQIDTKIQSKTDVTATNQKKCQSTQENMI